jgi:ERCC4-type nuclease
MSVRVVIDCNERALLAVASSVADNSFSFETGQLPVGDVAFYAGEKLVALAERKTYSDLDASIKDGRYREQRSRMKEVMTTEGGPVCFYILEGCHCDEDFRVPGSERRIAGALENLAIEHQMGLLPTKSIEDTYRTIIRLAEKLGKDHSRNAVPTFPKSRKATVSENLLPCMLSVIPGVSGAVAQAVAAAYPSLEKLADAWGKSANPGEMLKDIPVNKRKVGKAASQKLYASYKN